MATLKRALVHNGARRNADMETTATQKGQIVIPASVRRKLGIKAGTRIKIDVDEHNHHIILKPITRESVAKFRGILRLTLGQKGAVEQLMEDRAEDRRREEGKVAKHGVR